MPQDMVFSASADSPDCLTRRILDRANEPGGSMPRPHAVPRPHTLPSPVRRRLTPHHTLVLLARLLLLIALAISATPTHAAAQLWLPTPPGETWQVIQGYGC